jgi:hypothetical protein
VRSRMSLLVVLFGLLTAPATAAPILSLQPSSASATVGDVVSFDIVISAVEDLYGFQFDLGFDPDIVEALSITEGSFLGTGGTTFFLPGGIDNLGGVLSFTASSLIGEIVGAAGGGTLATVTFSAVAAGTSLLNIFNGVLLDSSLSGLTFETQNGSVTIAEGTGPNPVPEPASVILFATGALAALRSMRRRALV